MKTLNYRIVPLPTEVAEAARRTAAAGTSPNHAVVVADSPTDFPCRHCLRWAELGERLILFPFASVPAGHPYSEVGPIFVHAEACERYADTQTFPPQFRQGRALRAYDSEHEMIDAAVVDGDDVEGEIKKLLRNPKTDFIHARSVTRGCYTLGVARR